ncbi:hypothetical protein WCX72_09800 [Sulfurimonas sp. HSL1-6]|uniref:hypothetical protein n=1 Tax=Thiomicrolovo immobilis TaxID=3131935 RepID=UPI0031F9E80F
MHDYPQNGAYNDVGYRIRKIASEQGIDAAREAIGKSDLSDDELNTCLDIVNGMEDRLESAMAVDGDISDFGS